MKRFLLILTIFLTGFAVSISKPVPKSDSLGLMETFEKIHYIFENPNFDEFQKISDILIYCRICEELDDSSELVWKIDRTLFYEKYLEAISKSEYWRRVKKSNDVHILSEPVINNCDYSIIIVIYQQDEIAPGHEGGSIEINFNKINGNYIFSGIGSIP